MRRLVVAMVLASLAACVGSDHHPSRPPSTVTFGGSDAVLYVDIADTQAKQRRGLMGIERLPGNEGMAFVYEEPVEHSFWMKDTLIPLSIAFVDDAGRLVGLREMEPCRADPCPTYGVTHPYVLAVEANRGWFDDHGIEVGDHVNLEERAYL